MRVGVGVTVLVIVIVGVSVIVGDVDTVIVGVRVIVGVKVVVGVNVMVGVRVGGIGVALIILEYTESKLLPIISRR